MKQTCLTLGFKPGLCDIQAHSVSSPQRRSKPRKEGLPRASQGLLRGQCAFSIGLWVHSFISPGKKYHPILQIGKLRIRRVKNSPKVTQLDWNSGVSGSVKLEMPVVWTRTDFAGFDHIEIKGQSSRAERKAVMLPPSLQSAGRGPLPPCLLTPPF